MASTSTAGDSVRGRVKHAPRQRAYNRARLWAEGKTEHQLQCFINTYPDKVGRAAQLMLNIAPDPSTAAPSSDVRFDMAVVVLRDKRREHG